MKQPTSHKSPSVDLRDWVPAERARDEQLSDELLAASDQIHAERYPKGCPNRCEACCSRLNATELQKLGAFQAALRRAFPRRTR